jgi:hypothetical protein
MLRCPCSRREAIIKDDDDDDDEDARDRMQQCEACESIAVDVRCMMAAVVDAV